MNNFTMSHHFCHPQAMFNEVSLFYSHCTPLHQPRPPPKKIVWITPSPKIDRIHICGGFLTYDPSNVPVESIYDVRDYVHVSFKSI
jgi:hypothetical protein